MDKLKRGTKPINGVAMTPAQRKQRERTKVMCKVKAAKLSGCKVTPVLINDNQLLTLTKLSMVATKGTVSFNNTRLDDVVYHALKMYIETYKKDLIEWDTSADLVNGCDSTSYPDDYNALMGVEVKAQQLFKDWEQSQLTKGIYR